MRWLYIKKYSKISDKLLILTREFKFNHIAEFGLNLQKHLYSKCSSSEEWKFQIIFYYSILKRFNILREHTWGQAGGGAEGERESQPDSMLSMDPDVGLNLTTWDYDLRWNEELDA